MSGFGKRDATIHGPQTSRAAGSRFGDLTGRLTGAIAGHPPAAEDDEEYSLHADESVYEDSVLPLFAVVRQGYDCDAVDEHVTELEAALVQAERDLADLRRRIPSRSDIAAEIARLGEQTSAILITAHDAASETVTLAQNEAGTRIADAASYAAALREESQLERHRAQAELDSLRRERTRLIGDIQGTATALQSLASHAAARSASHA